MIWLIKAEVYKIKEVMFKRLNTNKTKYITTNSSKTILFNGNNN